MYIEIDNNKYEVDIIKKHNKNTYIRVKDGKIIVTTNYFSSNKGIIKIINDNLSSIRLMIDKDNKRKDKEEKFYYFGLVYDVIYGFNDIDIVDNKIYVKNKRELDKYINREIVKIFSERLEYYFNMFEEKIPVPNLKIRKMTSRWGVCNTKNHNVTLNYYLSRYDIKCLDYVVVHELSHFIHPNHSKNFWNLVSKYCPNYKECRRMLKE